MCTNERISFLLQCSICYFVPTHRPSPSLSSHVCEENGKAIRFITLFRGFMASASYRHDGRQHKFNTVRCLGRNIHHNLPICYYSLNCGIIPSGKFHKTKGNVIIGSSMWGIACLDGLGEKALLSITRQVDGCFIKSICIRDKLHFPFSMVCISNNVCQKKIHAMML